MEKNLSAKISLDELASLVNLEKSYFIRLFKKETGSTPFKILNGMRLDRASDLLATTDMDDSSGIITPAGVVVSVTVSFKA